jgi:hypothetical protein
MPRPEEVSKLDQLRQGNDGEFITRKTQELIETNPTPDDLIDYSTASFGPTLRLAAIQACEAQIDRCRREGNEDTLNKYLTVLPILWGLIDESFAG